MLALLLLVVANGVRQVDCFLQAELCQQPRWSEAASAAAAAGSDPATPPADVIVDGKTPMLFVVRKGEVFGYDGDAAASTAAEMVQFVKVVAAINGDALEEDGDEEDGLGEDDYGDDDEVWKCAVLASTDGAIRRTNENPSIFFLSGIILCAFACVFCWEFGIDRVDRLMNEPASVFYRGETK